MVVPESAQRQSFRIDQYDTLLIDSGLDAETVLADALGHQQPPRPASLSLAQCLEQPGRLVDQVRQDHPDTRDSNALRARLSVLQQDLALNVIAPLTLRLFLHGRTATPEPERIFLASLTSPGSDSSETSALSRWYQLPGGIAVDQSTFVTAVSEQIRAWYPVFRHSLGISPGAYWSSLGLGLGAPFSVVWNRARPEATCRLAQCWLASFDDRVSRFIDWIPAEFDGQAAAIPQRRGCCLKYLLPDGSYCGTCGVYRKRRLAAVTRHQRRNPAPGQWQPDQ